MKLLKLNISNFGLFHNKKIEFSDGLNLIYGKNESGKSTIHGFIKGILFGIEKTRGRSYANDIYDRFLPWDTPGSYDGSMEFKVNDKKYHIYRNFDKNNKETILTDVTTGRTVDFSQVEFQELINDLTRSSYEGTISIGQLKTKTKGDLAYHVQNHITNLTMTRSEEIDVKKALDNLRDKAKTYGLKALNEEVKLVEGYIEEGKGIEASINNLSRQIAEIEIEEEKLLAIKEGLINKEVFSYEKKKSLLAKFPVIKTQYSYYLENLDQCNQLRNSIIEIQGNQSNKFFNKISKIQVNKGAIKTDIEDIKVYKNNQRIIIKEKEEDKSRYEEITNKDRRKNLIITSSFFILGFIFIMAFASKRLPLVAIGISLIIIGIVINIILSFNNNKNKKDYLERNSKYLEDLTRIEDNISSIFNKYNIKSEYELQDKYEEVLKEDMIGKQQERELEGYQHEYIQLQERTKDLRDQIIDYVNNFPFIYKNGLQSASESLDEKMGRIDEYITDEIIKMNEYEDHIKPRLLDLSIKKEKINWELELLENKEEELIANQERYLALLIKEEDYKKETDSINLAINTIEEISTGIHDSFGASLNTLVSDIAKDITNGRYADIKIDEQLKIKTEVEDRYRYLESFSEGTIEQLSFSLRLAVADLIYGKGQVPILLDDTFAYYDDQRLRSTLKRICEDKERQVLLFTCHQREKNLLDSLEIPYHYIEL